MHAFTKQLKLLQEHHKTRGLPPSQKVPGRNAKEAERDAERKHQENNRQRLPADWREPEAHGQQVDAPACCEYRRRHLSQWVSQEEDEPVVALRLRWAIK